MDLACDSRLLDNNGMLGREQFSGGPAITSVVTKYISRTGVTNNCVYPSDDAHKKKHDWCLGV